MLRLGFVKSLWGVCGGTAVFDVLRTHGWFRIIWHLLLLSVLCTFGITVAANFKLSPDMERAAKSFDEQFGGVRMTERGFFPVTEPEKGRTLNFSDRIRLIYQPDLAEGVKIAPESLEALESCVVWSPKYLCYIGREPEAGWRVVNQTQTLRFTRFKDDGKLLEYLGNLRDPGTWVLPKGDQTMDSVSLFAAIKLVMLATFFVWSFLGVFLLPWIFTGIFVGVFRLTGRAFRSMSWGEYWKVGIYAGFPAMLVASFCAAFEVPYLQYNTAYMVGLMIYWMVVAARLERSWGGTENGGGADE